MLEYLNFVFRFWKLCNLLSFFVLLVKFLEINKFLRNSDSIFCNFLILFLLWIKFIYVVFMSKFGYLVFLLVIYLEGVLFYKMVVEFNEL